MPGTLVRSQLSRIPGEERKLRRRRIVAFAPGCRRERDAAVSQISVGGSPARGVAVASGGGGVAVGGAIGVGLGLEASVAWGGGGVTVGRNVLVSVDGGNGVQVGPEGSIVGVIGRAVAVSREEVGGTGEEGAPRDIKIRARISKTMATINLKRS